METLIMSEADGTRRRPFRDFITRYLDEVVPNHRSKREYIFLIRLLKHPIADIAFPTEEDFSNYRNERLLDVQGSTVLRELAVMSSICTTAVKEWRWLKENPLKAVKKPKQGKPRDRRVSDEEVEILKKACSYDENFPKTKLSRTVHAFMFAIETGMRASEIVGLTWDNIDFEKRTAFLPMTKNGEPRKVPLSARAIELLKQLPVESERAFNLTEVTTIFCKVKNKTDLKDLHFHDSRHEAITRMAKKVDVLSLARIVGHKRINQLMTYYNESAEDLALKL